MLNVMRKHAGSWMIKVILFAIVIVFVFWGVGSFRSRQASKVAVVNDEIISVTDYHQAYNNLIEQYRQRFGSSLNDDMIEMLQLKRQALDQLINRTIVLQEAEKLDLQVSEDEIAQSIMGMPVFQNDGTFDKRRYRMVLSQYHLTPETFEADQKNALIGEKLTRVILGTAKVTEEESKQWYDWQNTEVNVDYLFFNASSYTDIQPSESETAAYFDKNKEQFKTDPMVKVRYVVFDPKDDEKKVNVGEDEIREYYDANLADFKTEKTVEARHILIKSDSSADETSDQEAKSKAQEIADMAKSGKDFAELAKTYSEGPTKDRGGYLGKFQQSQMVKPFADKAFSMAPGEISDPVKTQFGWHVIKVESVEQASTKTLDESKPAILKTLKESKSKNLAYDRAEQFYEATFEKEDFINNAKTFGVTAIEAGPFSRKGPDALGPGKGQFASAAFNLKADEISDVLEIDGSYYIVQMMEMIDAAIPPIEDVKEDVVAKLTQKMQTDKARKDAEAAADKISAGQSFEDSAAKHALTVKQTGLFKRDGAVPGIGSTPQFTQAAFELSSPGSITKKPVEGNGGFYLLRLAERKAPPAAGFDKEKDDISSMLLQQKQQMVMQDWMEARKADSQITIEKSFLE